MRHYEVWQNHNNHWLIYEVTNYGQNYVLVKVFKTKKGAENWLKKTWERVLWLT